MDIGILRSIDSSLSNLDSSVSAFFSYLSHIGKAIDTCYTYVSSLPEYLISTCTLLIGIAIIYFVTGR